MKVSIYQINTERDTDRVKFQDLCRWPEKYGGTPDASLYDNVFSGEIDAVNLEEMFDIFNSGAYPDEYRGHSLSVSDVVFVKESDTVQRGAYYVQSIGFTRTMFTPQKKYDAIFWKVPEGEGLTPDMIEDAILWMGDAEAYIPTEIDNPAGENSAMGFLSLKATGNEAWIRRAVIEVISDIANEDPAQEYTVNGVSKAVIRIIT